MQRLLAPDLFQILVATRVPAVEVVADRVVFVIVLMISLRRIEGTGLADRGDDGFVVAAAGVQFLERCFRLLLLFFVVIEKDIWGQSKFTLTPLN